MFRKTVIVVAIVLPLFVIGLLTVGTMFSKYRAGMAQAVAAQEREQVERKKAELMVATLEQQVNQAKEQQMFAEKARESESNARQLAEKAKMMAEEARVQAQASRLEIEKKYEENKILLERIAELEALVQKLKAEAKKPL